MNRRAMERPSLRIDRLLTIEDGVQMKLVATGSVLDDLLTVVGDDISNALWIQIRIGDREVEVPIDVVSQLIARARHEVRSEERSALIQRCEEFLARPFPQRVDVDLIAVNSAVSGCVQTFIARGSLDEKRRSVLKSSIDEATDARITLQNDARSYFDELVEVANSIELAHSKGAEL
jgi:hypothetical protein